ncbi:MAG: hypothetical protein IPK60_00480 [Sandaracinaceae bacterium]|nr:hypothetical protein [Sandaracinaceae bacterium]
MGVALIAGMQRYWVTLCHLTLALAITGCFGSHANGPESPLDGGLDGGPELFDTGLNIRDFGPVDAQFACPPNLPVYTSTDVCEHEGQVCSQGGTSTCGSFYSCACREGHWACLVAEPDPACWCGRYPSVGSDCNTEGQECLAPSACDPSQPNLICNERHWVVDRLNNELCAPPAVCPVDGTAALGTSCMDEGHTCFQGECCEFATDGPHRPIAVQCSGGQWVPLGVDCVPDPEQPSCDEFVCGDGLCFGEQVCWTLCGPDDGVVARCIDNSEHLSCESLAARLGDSGAACSTDSSGHMSINSAMFCG